MKVEHTWWQDIPDSLRKQLLALTNTGIQGSFMQTALKWFGGQEYRVPLALAVDDGGFVRGWAMATPVPTEASWRNKRMQIELSVYVCSSQRRRGIGTMLARSMDERCRSLGSLPAVANPGEDNEGGKKFFSAAGVRDI